MVAVPAVPLDQTNIGVCVVEDIFEPPIGPKFLIVIAVPEVGRVAESVFTHAGPETVTVIDSFAVLAEFFCSTQMVAAAVVTVVALLATTELSVPSLVPPDLSAVPVLNVEVEAAVAKTSAAVTVTVHVTDEPDLSVVPVLIPVETTKLYVPATEGAINLSEIVLFTAVEPAVPAESDTVNSVTAEAAPEFN